MNCIIAVSSYMVCHIKRHQGCQQSSDTVYPKKYAHGFVVLCFVVVTQSFRMNSHEAFIHIHQGCVAGTGAIVRLPQCQWSKPDGYGKISQCITTTKHSKAKTVCIFLGIYWSMIKSQFELNVLTSLTCIPEGTRVKVFANLINSAVKVYLVHATARCWVFSDGNSSSILCASLNVSVKYFLFTSTRVWT